MKWICPHCKAINPTTGLETCHNCGKVTPMPLNSEEHWPKGRWHCACATKLQAEVIQLRNALRKIKECALRGDETTTELNCHHLAEDALEQSPDEHELGEKK